jgi:hypothetical protein
MIDTRQVLYVEDLILDAFNAMYPSPRDGQDWIDSSEGVFRYGADGYPYNVLVLVDRQDNRYLWAQAVPDDALTKPYSGLREGQFIKCAWNLHDLPGADQDWFKEVPHGQHIYQVQWRFAPKAQRFPAKV